MGNALFSFARLLCLAGLVLSVLACERSKGQGRMDERDMGGLVLDDPNKMDPMMMDPMMNPSPTPGPSLPEGCSPEVCNNGFDDDCNGLIDDGCACTLTMTQGCFSGPAAIRGVGACKDGVSTCVGDAEFQNWTACSGDVLPVSEVCDSGGVDENCDGAVNEGCECDPAGPPAVCGSDEGECVAGTQNCIGGVFGLCMGAIGPRSEVCNGRDDDCNGAVDEGLTRPCGLNVGICRRGVETCVAGVWGDCEGDVEPATEVCEGNNDENCDGEVDEGCLCSDGQTVKCGTDTGECVAGMRVCVGGIFGVCMGEIKATTEICDNKDNDCDGKTDEGLSRSCGISTGECSTGTETCAAGVWGTCSGSVGPKTEVCGNRLDDDCDGTADEVEECPVVVGPPIANCGSGINTVPLTTVTLSGSGSDPDGGTVTYRWTITARPSGSTSQPANPNSASTGFFVDLAGTYTATLTVTDNEGQTTTCTITINAVPPQQIHVELVWDTAWGDVDLHLTPPGATPAPWYTANACWFANRTASWGGGGAAGDATLDIDDRDGFGPENINITSAPAAGDYQIGVAFYCDKSVPRNPGERVNDGQGPNKATVKVYCAGNLVATYGNIALDKTGEFEHVASVNWPACTTKSVMSHLWTAEIQPTQTTNANPIHCAVPCTGNSQCTAGEKCVSGLCRID